MKTNFNKFDNTDDAAGMIARFEELAVAEALRVLDVEVLNALSHLFTAEQRKSIQGIIEIVGHRYSRDDRRKYRTAELKLWLEQACEWL